MTYKEFIHNIIITRGQWNIPENEYWEGHHIIPVCCGGSGNTKQKDKNIIRLYPEEHFIAHKLLYEENPNDEKIAWAYICMSMVSKTKNQERKEITPEEYGELARLRSKLRKGKKHTDESKQKMSKTKKLRYSKEQHPFYGKHLSDEHKQKISQNHANVKGENNPFFGKKHTKDTKNKIGKKSKGRVHTEDTKKKIGDAHRGICRSEESKKKESNTVKKQWQDPEYRQKHIENMKGVKKIFKTTICEYCGREITLSNIQSHLNTHINGSFEKKSQVYHVDHDDLFCKFCGKECKNKRSLSAHERLCKNRIQ